jgi:hypothetical protein
VNLRKLSVAVLCLAAIASTLAACSSGSNNAGPTTTTISATTTTDPVPTVAHPLDSSKFENTPCSSLTTAQVEALGVPAPTADNTPGAVGSACTWSAGGDSGILNAVAVTWDTSDSNGMQYAYQRKSKFKYWTTTSVDGYPAVLGDVLDERPSGTCAVNVGVSDHMLFIVHYYGRDEPQKSQSCQLVVQVAADVLKNLGG